MDDGPCPTIQNPADVVGETVFDCRPSVLPVSIPLRGLRPGTIAEARESRSFRPSEETGKSIMDMDTNEITINRIVGFEWDKAGTDLEDEMPTPVLSPVQIVAPVIPPTGTADLFIYLFIYRTYLPWVTNYNKYSSLVPRYNKINIKLK